MEFNLSIKFGDEDSKQGKRGAGDHMSQLAAGRKGNGNGKVLPFTPYKFILRHPHEATAEDILLRDGGIAQAGAGSWLHAACHLITAIASPAALAPLPFAIATLGWPAGVGTLAIFILISFYCSMCMASLWEWDGVAYSSYRDLIGSLFGNEQCCGETGGATGDDDTENAGVHGFVWSGAIGFIAIPDASLHEMA